jgi:hypothetical protein
LTQSFYGVYSMLFEKLARQEAEASKAREEDEDSGRRECPASFPRYECPASFPRKDEHVVLGS